MKAKLTLGILLLAVAALVMLLVSGGCSGMRFGIRSMFRGAADYDALDDVRPETSSVGAPAMGTDAPPAYWSSFLGPNRDSTYAEGPVDLDWPEDGPPLLWRAVVGPAYSSIVVGAGLAVTMEQRREHEVVVAFDALNGAEIWTHSWEARFSDLLSKEGPRATPLIVETAAGEVVVATGATGEVRCLELRTGAKLWRRDVQGDAENLQYGLAASPLLMGDVVVVQSSRSAFALALDSGDVRWKALDEKLAYASPQTATLGGREVLLVTAAARVVALDPATGAELWSVPWEVQNDLSNTQPFVIGKDRLLLSAGYGKGAELFAVGGAEPKPVWRSARLKTRFNNPVLYDGLVFGLDEGVLVCIDPEDGRRLWKAGRFGYGQLLLVQGRLVVLAEDGDVVLLPASREEPEEERRFEALDGTTINPPCLAHGRLYVRNHEEMACFDLREP